MGEGFIKGMLDGTMLASITMGFEGVLQKGFSNAIQQLEGASGLKFGSESFSPFGAIKYWDDIHKAIKDTNKGLGVAGTLGKSVEESFMGTLDDAINMGLEFKDIAEEYQKFVMDVGRNRELTSNEMKRLAEVKAVYGEGATEIFGAFDNLGVSIKDTSKGLQRAAKSANKIGVSSLRVIQELKKNIGAINKFSFREGRKGLEKMAELAIQTKISIGEALKLSDNIWEKGIEGAIEMGAEMQNLGGAFAQMGDPFELYYQARNDPKEFMSSIQDAAKSVAHFNAETGEIDINALGMSQLREFSKITGVALDELSQTARIARKEMELEGLFDSSIRGGKDFESVLTKVAGAASFDKDLNDWVVNIAGVEKRVSELKGGIGGDIGKLDVISEGTDENQVFQSVVNSNETLVSTLTKLIDTLKVTIIPKTAYQAGERLIQKPAEQMRQDMISGDLGEFLQGLKETFEKAGDNFAKVLEPTMSGDWTGAASAIGNNVVGTATGFAGLANDYIIQPLVEELKKMYEGSWVQSIVTTFNKLIIQPISWAANKIGEAITSLSNLIDTLGGYITAPFSALPMNLQNNQQGTSTQEAKASFTNFETRSENITKIRQESVKKVNEAPSKTFTHTISIKAPDGAITKKEFTNKQWMQIKDYVIQLSNGDAISGKTKSL